jgi:hypothetical protein
MDKDERLKIMKMVQEGKISLEEGMELLDILEAKGKAQRPVSSEQPVGGSNTGKWARIRITDMDTGRPRVNVRLPMGFIKAGMKFGARFTPDLEDIDFSDVVQAAREGGTGQIIDVYDEDDREHVEIFIE